MFAKRQVKDVCMPAVQCIYVLGFCCRRRRTLFYCYVPRKTIDFNYLIVSSTPMQSAQSKRYIYIYTLYIIQSGVN